jgi:hypothetical protein
MWQWLWKYLYLHHHSSFFPHRLQLHQLFSSCLHLIHFTHFTLLNPP